MDQPGFLGFGRSRANHCRCVFARTLSAIKKEHVAGVHPCSPGQRRSSLATSGNHDIIRKAMLSSKICSYAQNTLAHKENKHHCEISSLQPFSSLWRARCIIPARDSWERSKPLRSQSGAGTISSWIPISRGLMTSLHQDWRKVVALAAGNKHGSGIHERAVVLRQLPLRAVVPANLLASPTRHFWRAHLPARGQEGKFPHAMDGVGLAVLVHGKAEA